MRGSSQVGTSNVLYKRVSMIEMDVYRDRGGPQPTKHLVVHNKYCWIINRQVGHSIEQHNSVKPPKVLEPKAYTSEEDTKEFKRWL